ncbi:MAG TPA: hypothetical protein VER08_00095 [Pyrinomonadaceae bacterium]|nr:hypothetical protein [Pyrinomonadaceae bacterium]
MADGSGSQGKRGAGITVGASVTPVMDAPASEWGPGYFVQKIYDGSVQVYHRVSGAVRETREAVEVVGHYTAEQFEGAWCVYQAVTKAPSYTSKDVTDQTGQALTEVLNAIVPGLLFSAAVLALSAIAGATVGALLGAFAGGAGAIPGAGAGAAAGLEVGTALLGWLGLGMLGFHVVNKLGEVNDLITGGVRRAWNARSKSDSAQRDEIDLAAHEMSLGMAVFIRLILEGIVIYLTKKAGNKIGDITKALRGSRFARFFKLDRLARWLDKNYPKLLKEPKLQPKPQGKPAAPQTKPAKPPKPPKQPGKPDATGKKAPAKKQKAAKDPNKKGGAYKDVPAKGGEVHHTPADSISPLSRGAGPGFRMEKADHMKTASWGKSKSAQAYRAKQKKLIEEGKFREAVEMDIKDVRSKFGNKYDEGISQMLEYLKTIPPDKLKFKPPSP